MLNLKYQLINTPSSVQIRTQNNPLQAIRSPSGDTWTAQGVNIYLQNAADSLVISATVEPKTTLQYISLRWQARLMPEIRLLGDAFERAYGNLEWRGIVPERPLPWYFLLHSREGKCAGAGVKTLANCFATWKVDYDCIILELDCRSGGVGVMPGERILQLATVVVTDSKQAQSPMAHARVLCSRLCDQPVLPAQPVYGANNWYYAYGQTSHEECVEDAKRVSAWADSANRPFMVLDDGWQEARSHGYNGGPWQRGNHRFPDMQRLASEISSQGARPGIWYRPLLSDGMLPREWAIQAPRPHGWTDHGMFLDPTIPDVRELLKNDMLRLVNWGYELIKHDFTTYDLLGYWGSGLGGERIDDGWKFHDQSRTSAEIIKDLYQLLRTAAGDALLLGCNTVGHLATGTHEIQRTGDDTSGQDWERTRKMGVNTLAFRMPQHQTFFAVDADCVGLTRHVPWELNAQWLDLLARSGTPLFLSAAPDAVGPEQERAIRKAFHLAAVAREPAHPDDWLHNTCPREWTFADGKASYRWQSFF